MGDFPIGNESRIAPAKGHVPVSLREIGSSGLRGGRVRWDMIYVTGPCGQRHAMSLDEAREVRDWLTEQLADHPSAKEGT